MTYGILLRWDVTRTQKVSLVVLRKNCHESFYKTSVPTSSLSAWFPETMVAPKLSETRVTVLFASGFKKSKNHWTVRLSLGDETENILLTHDDLDDDKLVPKLNSTITGSSDELVVQLLEHQRHSRHLRTTLRVPTASLQPHATQLRIPCPDGGFLQLEAIVREWETSGPPIVSEEPAVDVADGWEWMLCMVC